MTVAAQTVPDHQALDCPDCHGRGTMRLTAKPRTWKGRSPWMFRCMTKGCSGLCGAHADGRPLGIPADAETRRARRLTHALLDKLWNDAWRVYNIPEDGRGAERAKKAIAAKARSRTYAWLADQLGISSDICHVSMMDLVQLRTAYAALQRATFHGIREWAKELGR